MVTRYISAFALLIVTFNLFGQNRERVEFNIEGLYKGVYSEVYEQPLEVIYTVKCPNGDASRTGMDFYTDDKIHTSDNEDYSESAILTNSSGELIHEKTNKLKSDAIEKEITFYNCQKLKLDT